MQAAELVAKGASANLAADVVPTLAVGAGCSDDAQCLSGACDRETFVVCGKCIERKTSGACYANSACAVGFYCQFTDTHPGHCTADITEGRSCDGSVGYGITTHCADGLACMSATKTCQKTLGEGQTGCDPAARESGCEKSLRCVGTTCVAVAKLGEACESRGDLQTCGEGLVCVDNAGDGLAGPGTCKQTRVKKPGEECSYTVECISGGCNGRPISAPVEGETGHYTGPGKCSPRVPAGGSCDLVSAICEANLACSQGKCVDPKCK